MTEQALSFPLKSAALSGSGRRFVRCLKRDLEAESCSVQIKLDRNTPYFDVDFRHISTQPAVAHETYPVRYRRGALERIDGLQVNGRAIQLEKISPEVHFCVTRQDHEVFTHFKFAHALSSGLRPGRRIRALVVDAGQKQPSLMGIIQLSSPIYSLRSRDAFLGWTSDGKAKEAGLRRLMDLSTCVSVPPYRYLRCGKLLAALALSSLVAERFGDRYSDDLAGVTSTCATGLHYPQLNRVMVRKGGLYRRIGQTSGYSTSLFREDTLSAARDLISLGRPASAFGPNYVKAIPLLRNALHQCGLPSEPFLKTGINKGVYFGALYTNSSSALRHQRRLQGKPISSDEAILWWKGQVLKKSVAKTEIIRLVQTYSPPPTQ